MADTQAELDAALDSRWDDVPDDLGAPPAAEAEPTQAPESTSAPADDSVAQTAPEGSTPAPVSPSTSAAPEPDPFANFLAKYGGDRAKAADAYWSTSKRNAELAAKVEELEKRLTAPSTPAEPGSTPEPTPAPPVPQELQRYDETLRDLQSQHDNHAKTITEYEGHLARAKQRAEEVADFLAQEGIDFEAEQKAKAERRSLKTYITRTEAFVQNTKREQKELLREKQLQEFQRERVAREVEDRQAREAQTTAERQRQQKEFADDFYGQLKQMTSEMDPEDREEFWEMAEGLGLRQAPARSEFPSFLAKVKERFEGLKARGRKQLSIAHTQTKAADVNLSAPTGKAAVATPPAKRRWESQAELDRHIDAAFDRA